MLKYYILLIALAASTTCDEARKTKQSDDPFTLMDRLVHYMFPPRVKLWPWYDLFQSANPLENPKLVSNKDKCEINLHVKKFQPEDLKVRVKNRYVIVEGQLKQQESDIDSFFMVNRFVQNFALPLGCNEDEIVAILENGVLKISAPKHELPPPPPERVIPIEVKYPVIEEETTEIMSTTEKKEVQPLQTSSPTPLDAVDLVEATTHVGKIRKKELKTTKTSKDNEVTKGDNNGLDYSPVSENE